MADTIQMKDKVNSTLEHLKDGKEVGEKDLEMMKEVLSDKEALKLLEKKLEENFVVGITKSLRLFHLRDCYMI